MTLGRAGTSLPVSTEALLSPTSRPILTMIFSDSGDTETRSSRSFNTRRQTSRLSRLPYIWAIHQPPFVSVYPTYGPTSHLFFPRPTQTPDQQRPLRTSSCRRKIRQSGQFGNVPVGQLQCRGRAERTGIDGADFLGGEAGRKGRGREGPDERHAQRYWSVIPLSHRVLSATPSSG
jgi:hypothetical protein